MALISGTTELQGTAAIIFHVR